MLKSAPVFLELLESWPKWDAQKVLTAVSPQAWEANRPYLVSTEHLPNLMGCAQLDRLCYLFEPGFVSIPFEHLQNVLLNAEIKLNEILYEAGIITLFSCLFATGGKIPQTSQVVAWIFFLIPNPHVLKLPLSAMWCLQPSLKVYLWSERKCRTVDGLWLPPKYICQRPVNDSVHVTTEVSVNC